MTAATLDAALLRAVARLEDEVAHLRRTLEAHTAMLAALLALPASRDVPPSGPTPGAPPPPPEPAAPLAAGGGGGQPRGVPADFPTSFRGRSGGQPRGTV